MDVQTLLMVTVVLLLLAIFSRLRHIEAGVRKLLELQGMGAGPSEPTEEVVRLARAGQTIEAMRLYRWHSGADVREAKRRIDALPNGD